MHLCLRTEFIEEREGNYRIERKIGGHFFSLGWAIYIRIWSRLTGRSELDLYLSPFMVPCGPRREKTLYSTQKKAQWIKNMDKGKDGPHFCSLSFHAQLRYIKNRARSGKL